MNVYLKKQNFWRKKALTGFVALIILMVFLNIFQQPIKNIFYFITSPISKTFWKAGDSASGFFASFLNVKGLSEENNNLKQENQNLLSQISFLQDTVKQDQSIQSVIKNTQTDRFKLALAETIGLNGDIMLINKGSDDGIAENMPVISSAKVLYGKIYKVYKNYSQVMLISNKKSVVDIKIQNSDTAQTPISGAIKGNGNLALYLDLVSSDAQIKEGDVLIASGLEGVFPKDLLIGKIIKIDKNDLKPFQTAQIQPFFDVKNAENLFIVLDYKK